MLLAVACLAQGPAAAQGEFSEAALACYQQAARGEASALETCGQAASSGDAHATFLLALAERDAERRLARLERAVELGHARAAAVLAQVLRRQGENQRAAELELMAARRGFGPSQIRVAQSLRLDRENTQNLAQARNILLGAAASGYPQAQYLVAGMLKAGEGGDVDDAAAGAWMLEAASSGHTQAQFELGLVRGQSNPREGQRWLTKAARAGHVGAMYQLARLINASQPDRNGKLRARYWANRAILFGHPGGTTLLAAIGDPAAAPAPSATQPSSPAGRDSRNLVARVQQALTDLGYDPGPVDGLTGGRTISAIEAFQRSRNLPVSGEISQETLGQLVRALGSPQ